MKIPKFFQLICLLALNSAACVEFKEEPPPQQDLQPGVDQVGDQAKKNDSNFSASLVKGEYANEYAIRLGFRDVSNPVVRKTVIGTNKTYFLNLNGSGFEYLDTDIESKHSYRYELGTVDGENMFSMSQESTVAVPIDLLAEEFEALVKSEKSPITVGRVFFGSKPIVTFGRAIEINADEIVSDNSVIETFPESQTARDGVAGRFGGRISIKANSARGKLTIFLRGENGGQGIRPAGRPPKAPQGHEGNNGTVVIHGLGSDRVSYTCEGFKEAGNGHPGLQGFPGVIGLPGGSTGELHVEILEPQESFKLVPIRVPGRGGLGSQGGFGGEGGDSGPYLGARFEELHSAHCPPQKAQSGPTGPEGSPGPLGPDGLNDVVCMKLSTSSASECR